MKLYYIYRIEKDGTPKKKMQIHANEIRSAWAGSKSWFLNGLFLVTDNEGTEAQTFKK